MASVGIDDMPDDRFEIPTAATRPLLKDLAFGSLPGRIEPAPTRSDQPFEPGAVAHGDRGTIGGGNDAEGAKVGGGVADQALHHAKFGNPGRHRKPEPVGPNDCGVSGSVVDEGAQRGGFIRTVAAPARPIDGAREDPFGTDLQVNLVPHARVGLG